jgi:predicted transcriptional regulator of viral defense system
METITAIFENCHGYAYLKDLKKQGIHTDTIRRLVQDGAIEKVKAGLYKLTDAPVLSNQGMIDVCMAMPKAVVCLHSALSYYDLTTTLPSAIMIALPRDSKPVKLPYPPIQVFYFSSPNYQTGIERVATKAGIFAIYNIEKTIVDCFRYRHKLGMDVALEGLRSYFKRPGYKMNTLIRYAKAGRMLRVMKPYIEAVAE